MLNNTLGSDHCPTVISINERQSFSGQLGPPKFKLSKADWRRFKGICNEKLSAAAMHDDTIDTHAQQVTQAIVSAAEACIPQSKTSCKLKHAPLPYWNDDCKNSIYERNRARNKLNNKKSPENAENYKRLKGIAQKTIKKAANDYWEEFCGTLNRKSNLSAIWNMAKRMNGTQTHSKSQNLIYDGKTIDNDLDKANFFANSFSKISSDENYSSTFRSHKRQIEQQEEKQNSIENDVIETGENTLDDGFNLSELRRAIRETKKHSAPGDDKICYEMLQHLSKRSTKLLLDLYNRVWTEGIFPSAWRHSIIIPVLKSGKDPQDFSSYRPISLTSTVGKVMEKLVTNRLTYHLEKNKLLTNVQTGFRKGKSTIDHIIRLQDAINKYNNNKGYSLAVFIDFQSAYDMVWHTGLLCKLKKWE